MVCTVAHSPKIGASALTDVAVNNNFSTEKGDQQWQHDPCKGQPSAQIGLTKTQKYRVFDYCFSNKNLVEPYQI